MVCKSNELKMDLLFMGYIFLCFFRLFTGTTHGYRIKTSLLLKYFVSPSGAVTCS
jgi:hypothetical protein